MRVEPGTEFYDAVFAFWGIEGKPARFSYQGSDWLAIRDNEKMVFIRTGSASGFDSTYGGSSLPSTTSR